MAKKTATEKETKATTAKATKAPAKTAAKSTKATTAKASTKTTSAKTAAKSTKAETTKASTKATSAKTAAKSTKATTTAKATKALTKTAAKSTKATTTKASTKATSAKTAKSAAMRKQSAEEKALAKELQQLLPSLDSEGLQFLLDQARIHLYNMQVDQINAARANAIASGGTKDDVPQPCSLEIKRGQNSDVYHIICNGRFFMFNSDEMLSIIKICHANDADDLEIKSRLYHWFFRERRDFLNDNSIADIHCEEFDLLLKIIKTRFKI